MTCTPITAALLQGLENAGAARLAAIFDEPGVVYPDGTLHYVGDDQNADGGYQGTIVLTLGAAGQVTAIDASLDNPTQGGAYYTFRWTEGGNACSDIPGSQLPC